MWLHPPHISRSLSQSHVTCAHHRYHTSHDTKQITWGSNSGTFPLSWPWGTPLTPTAPKWPHFWLALSLLDNLAHSSVVFGGLVRCQWECLLWTESTAASLLLPSSHTGPVSAPSTVWKGLKLGVSSRGGCKDVKPCLRMTSASLLIVPPSVKGLSQPSNSLPKGLQHKVNHDYILLHSQSTLVSSKTRPLAKEPLIRPPPCRWRAPPCWKWLASPAPPCPPPASRTQHLSWKQLHQLPCHCQSWTSIASLLWTFLQVLRLWMGPMFALGCMKTFKFL